ncbi:type II toxin-antitoxin system PemK/MazF family toxin [Nocardia sp. NPDC127526]|uniref:type II toxin-antitoxin system PemK/MazF family toxin n=1 Tax=Nocardia sp. NPDC127526 TaxID=3345393 RepID=UPI0036297962
MTAPAAFPRRGEVWAFTMDIAGRDAPPSLGPDRVLVVSTSKANVFLPHVVVLPITNAPVTDLTVLLGPDDPAAGHTVDITRMRSIPKRWLVARLGALTRPTMRQVYAAEIEFLGDGEP